MTRAILLALLAAVFGGASVTAAEISVGQGSGLHRFVIDKDHISAVGRGKEPLAISKNDARSIQAEIVRIIWMSNYGRKPASQKSSSCTPYAVLSSGADKSTICAENARAVGRTMGVLSQISQLLRN